LKFAPEAQIQIAVFLIERQRVDRSPCRDHPVGIGQVFDVVAIGVKLLHPCHVADVHDVIGSGFGAFAVDGDVAAEFPGAELAAAGSLYAGLAERGFGGGA
jgi:hypothetical protein